MSAHQPRSVLVLALCAAPLFGCERLPTTVQSSDAVPNFADGSAHVNSSTATSVATAASYLVVSPEGAFARGFETSLQRAGGRVVRAAPDLGVALVVATDGSFEADARRLRGVRWVIPDLRMAWIAPVASRLRAGVRRDAFVPYELGAAAFGTPPSSGDDDFFFDLQWGHAAIDAPGAWNASARGSGARIAILDSGIDATHPDLTPNLNAALSASFIEGETFFDVVPFSHGTHVSGIAAAADNGFGTIGVAPEAELVMIKVLEAATGSGSLGSFFFGLLHAVQIGADVVNMSLGVTLSHRGEVFDAEGNFVARIPARDVAGIVSIFTRVMNFAHGSGATLIAAAGNAATDGDRDLDRIEIPRDLPHVISVSATGPLGWGVDPTRDLDEQAFFTNFGQSVIDVAAPGGNLDFSLLGDPLPLCSLVLVNFCALFDWVFSTDAGGWSWNLGTSMAAPHVTGVAALIIGKNGGSMHPDRVRAVLLGSADDLGKPGRDDLFGRGRVNAARAVGGGD